MKEWWKNGGGIEEDGSLVEEIFEILFRMSWEGGEECSEAWVDG